MDKTTKKDIAICIFAYNRLLHLKRTIESLLKQDIKCFPIYIFQDGPKDNADEIKTKKVKVYLESLDTKLDIVRMHRRSNVGLKNSVVDGLNTIFSKHDAAIILEDDIDTRQGFIDFMVKGLEYYKEVDNVAGISGYSYMSRSLAENYFLPIGCSWGWGTWKRVWKNFRLNSEYYKKAIEDRDLIEKFNFGGYPFFNILEGNINNKVDSWAIDFYANFFLNNQIFLYPAESLCRNIGFDGSGTHTSTNNEKFNTEYSTSRVTEIMPSAELQKPILHTLMKRMKYISTPPKPNILYRIINKLANGR